MLSIGKLGRGLCKALFLEAGTSHILLQNPEVLGVDLAVLVEKSCNFFSNYGGVVKAVKFGEFFYQSLL